MARKNDKPMSKRTIGLAALGTIVGAGAAAFAAFRMMKAPGEGHAAPDLAPGADPVSRAPAAFRPDPQAPMTAAEREALRPATSPVPAPMDRESIALS